MRHLITFGCLILACVLYTKGLSSQAGFVLLGAVFEIAFWIRLMRGRRAP